MMRKAWILMLALALAPALASPAAGQSNEEQRRWDAAHARYQAETDAYQQERDRYMRARDRDARGPGYGRPYDAAPPPPPPGDTRYETGYDAARYYRAQERAEERRLDARDDVYRGSDGRYYCKRGDGTVGLVIGGAGGAVLGNVLDGGRHRAAGTLIGGAIGALVGKSVAEQQDLRCR